jgi:hypothetical protein
VALLIEAQASTVLSLCTPDRPSLLRGGSCCLKPYHLTSPGGQAVQ